ncbi:MAG: penicillin-binding protein 2 [Lachnospiraceae bacterium]|nr:penicillin-binding protein 2 [Lachnospiraceae bacterium]
MNKKPKNRSSVKRLAITLVIVGLFLIACLVRAVSLVISDKDEYYHKALAQAAGSSRAILARPGVILDANGTALAENAKVYRLILDPKVMNTVEQTTNPGSLDETVRILVEAFGLSESELREAFTADTTRSYLRFGGETIFSEEEMERYNTLVEEFNAKKTARNKAAAEDKSGNTERITAKVAGVWFEEEYRRVYPYQDLLSKVIGYTTRDATQGLIGLELQYNDILRGTDGKEYTYIDENGNVTKEVTAEQDGQTLITSLDANVARIVKEEIAAFMEETGGERINVLVMNPSNGEVIAMESDTNFDLNNPRDLTQLFTEEELENPAESFLLTEAFRGRMSTLENMSQEDQLEALLQQVQSNYTISSSFEPGSTGKALTLAAGIESRSISADETFFCDGTIQVGKYTIHCHLSESSLCGSLKPIEAFGRSCNVCFVQINNLIGRTTFAKFQELFNLGQKTGIDLPGEAQTAGLIYSAEKLHEIELATNSFGQGYNTSMLQLASAYCSLINGGYYYQPHVVTRIEDGNGNTIREVEPVLVRRTVSEETSDYMREAFKYVVTRGTASGILYRPEYSFGGKTGAAEKLPRGTGKYIVSFIGMAPLDSPRFLVYVAIDEPHVEDQSASAPACTLAAQIIDRLFVYYSVFETSADDAYSYDWSRLGDYKGMTDQSGGESFVDDPDQTIDWLETDPDDDRN